MRTLKLIILVVLLLAAGFLGYLGAKRDFRFGSRVITSINDTIVKDTISIPRLYGLPIDSFKITVGTVRQNQTLGQIMEQYFLPAGILNQLATYSSQMFDIRKIRAGNKYTAFVSQDTLNRLKYLVYEHSPVDYVVFTVDDTFKVDVKQKEVETRKKAAAGVIEYSLWQTMIDNDINPMIALELSEIYAWTIDFFGLQPEDSFSIVYDELFVDTVSIGLGDVHAAYFSHGDKDLYAIPFMQDSVISFFDLDGNSLRRAFLKAPLRYSRISSGYSSGRMHPILRIVRPHYGVDYAAASGTPVYSIGDGRVTSTGYDSGSGNIVRITHNSVYSTAYMHLRSFAPGIRAGVYVKQGDVIGYVGTTGLSTGPHLDFRVYRNGSPINPLTLESPPVDPIKSENRVAFDSVKAEKILELQAINITTDPVDIEKKIFADLIKGTLLPGSQGAR